MQEMENFRVFEDLTAEGETLAQSSAFTKLGGFFVQSATNSSLKLFAFDSASKVNHPCTVAESQSLEV